MAGNFHKDKTFFGKDFTAPIAEAVQGAYEMADDADESDEEEVLNAFAKLVGGQPGQHLVRIPKGTRSYLYPGVDLDEVNGCSLVMYLHLFRPDLPGNADDNTTNLPGLGKTVTAADVKGVLTKYKELSTSSATRREADNKFYSWLKDKMMPGSDFGQKPSIFREEFHLEDILKNKTEKPARW